MAIRALVSRLGTASLSLPAPLPRRLSGRLPFCSKSSTDVSDICRILSDYRQPHHDLESALARLSAPISPSVVEQVLKRCKGLGVSAHRFFYWAGKIPGFTHSINSYHILVEILGRCRQFPLIWDLLLHLRDGERCDHEIVRSELFWLVFRSYCRAKLPKDAVRAFEKMGDFGITPDVDDCHQLLLNLCGNRLMDDATEVFRKMKDEFDVTPKTYCILMKGWMDSANPAEAIKMFDEMLSSCTPDLVAYNTYMAALCQLDNFDAAYKLLKEIRAHGFELDASTYSVLLRAHCQKNDVSSADQVLCQMRRYNLVSNVVTYNCVAKLFCRNRMAEKAYEVLDEMVEKGVKPDIWSYNVILTSHCKLKEVNKALRLLKRIYEGGSCQPDLHTYNMLLKMLLDVGRIDRALEVWDEMGEHGFYPSSSTYAVMIHGLCKKKGKAEDGCRYFEMMVEEGIPPYFNTCQMLRDCLLQSGLQDKLYVIRRKMQQSTSVSIQELADAMLDRRRRSRRRVHEEEEEEEDDDQILPFID